MDFKCDLFFEAGKYGWTETYYRENATWATVERPAKELASARGVLLAGGATIKQLRISDVEVKRDSKVYVSDQWMNKANANEPSDLAFVTLLCRLNSGNKYWRSLMLAGIPDAYFAGVDTESALKPHIDKQVKVFLDQLVSSDWCIRALDRDTEGAPKVLQDAVRNDDGTEVTITVANHGYPALSKVRISGGTGTSVDQIKGVHTVFAPDTNTFKIRVALGEAALTYTGNATVSRRFHKLFPITDNTILRITSRQRGIGSFFRPRGASRKAK